MLQGRPSNALGDAGLFDGNGERCGVFGVKTTIDICLTSEDVFQAS